MTVELWIVRHGAAAERGPDWPDDAARPLLKKGERQARRLATIVPPLDRLFTSPWTRAAQTAAALADLAPAGAEPLEVLAVGEAADPAKPRKVVSSSAARRRPAEESTGAPAAEDAAEPAPLIKEADPEFEKLLDEEEQIARSTKEHHETPHFRPGEAD